MPHSKIKGKGYSLSPRDSALPCILCPPLLHLKPLPCIFCPPLLHLKPNKPQSYAHSLIKSRAVGRFFVFLVMLRELVWGVWKQIWWTACPRLYSAQAPAGTAAWLTALRSATHLPDCCRVGVKEIWNAWDPDCFIAGLSEPLYGLVLLGFAISPRLGGVTFAALNIKRQHHTIYISSFYLAERKREGERVGKRKKKKKGNRIVSVPWESNQMRWNSHQTFFVFDNTEFPINTLQQLVQNTQIQVLWSLY